MKMARAIQGGLGPIDTSVAANQQRIEEQAEVLRQQEQRIQQQGLQIAANDARIVATTGMVEANAARISDLDDYNVIGSVTVYFANGQSTVPSKYRHQLEDLIAQAKDVRAYIVQVQGYASAVGADSLNERLSTDRAVAVTRVLQQNGVPPTNLVPPAGMGVIEQVAPNQTEKGQARESPGGRHASPEQRDRRQVAPRHRSTHRERVCPDANQDTALASRFNR